jgi:ABC-type phosphate transport system substrate-binding protein
MKRSSLMSVCATAAALSALLFVETPAHAANPKCDQPTAQGSATVLPGTVVYFTGSTAAKPMIKEVSKLLAARPSPIRMIYQSVGSCQGLSDFTTNTKEPKTGTYWDETNGNVDLACDPPDVAGITPDVAISDVFPTSCSNITLGANQKDFPGSAQIFDFVVPPSSKENAISMESAFVVYGFGGQTNVVSPWGDPAFIFLRDPTKSGTYAMTTKLLALAPTKMKGTIPGAGGSQDVLNAVHGADAQNANGAIGILSSDWADANRSGASAVKILAYQHKGAACGMFPDSTRTALDKLNVRMGLYPFWGPIHYVTTVDGGGTPVSATVAAALSYFTREGLTDEATKKSMIDYEIAGFTVPQCAMKVKRTAEVAPTDSGLVSYTPAEQCGCYFEFKATGSAPSTCKSCSDDTGCSGATPKCHFGYCEAQ